jgi:L-cysteine S-thiosulfotransferase
MARWGRVLLCAAALAGEAPAAEFEIVADAIPRPLEGRLGDAARGRAIVASRQQGLCLLCHSAPIPEERFQGNLAPSLAGAGARWSAGQLRLKLADGQRLNPDSIMPAYYRSDGLRQVGSEWRGRTIFSAQQLEDVVAYLLTLKD